MGVVASVSSAQAGGNLERLVNLNARLWSVRGNWSTQRKPTKAQGEYATNTENKIQSGDLLGARWRRYTLTLVTFLSDKWLEKSKTNNVLVHLSGRSDVPALTWILNLGQRNVFSLFTQLWQLSETSPWNIYDTGTNCVLLLGTQRSINTHLVL